MEGTAESASGPRGASLAPHGPRIGRDEAPTRSRGGSEDSEDRSDEDDGRTGDDGEEGLHERPGLECFADGHAEILLDEPEARVVDMREEDRPRTDREDQETGLDRGHLPRERGHDARGSDGRDRRGTGCEADCDGDEPSGDERRNGGLLDPCGDDVGDARIDEGLFESAAGADDEEDACNGPEGGSDHRRDVLGAATGDHSEDEDRHEDGEEQGDDRLTKEDGSPVDPRPRGVAREGLDDGAAEHEDHGKEDDGDRGEEGGALLDLNVRLRSERSARLDGDPTRHEARGDRTGDDDRRNGDEKTEAQGDAQVRAEGVDRNERPGVGWHEAVKRGQAGERGDSHEDEGLVCAAGDEHDDGDQQDNADLEEQRDANDEGDEGHCPGEPGHGRLVEDGVNDLVGAARVDEEFADDGAEGNECPDAADGGAEAAREGGEGVAQGDSRGKGEDRRAEGEGEEGVDLLPDDQDDDRRDARERGADESDITIGVSDGVCGAEECRCHGFLHMEA